jgi:hypothetical protein
MFGEPSQGAGKVVARAAKHHSLGPKSFEPESKVISDADSLDGMNAVGVWYGTGISGREHGCMTKWSAAQLGQGVSERGHGATRHAHRQYIARLPRAAVDRSSAWTQ